MTYGAQKYDSLKEKYREKDTFWRRWTAVAILVVCVLLIWGGQFVSQIAQVKQQREEHGQVFTMDEFWPEFWSADFENWQSDWLQLITQAILIAALADYLFRKGNRRPL